jgi:GrpB-like predicted nucleotidyltransferase (UPF0157 family)
MVLGLKHGMAKLSIHDPKWKVNANEMIKQLWSILGDIANDIQHVGSTSIHNIKAKPVVDIAVSVSSFEKVLELSPVMEENGFIFIGWEGKDEKQPVYQCGEYIPGEKNMEVLTHYIKIKKKDSQEWYDLINFRDYMNAFPVIASQYEALKMELAEKYKDDYRSYHQGKTSFITKMIIAANCWNDSGRGNCP